MGVGGSSGGRSQAIAMLEKHILHVLIKASRML